MYVALLQAFDANQYRVPQSGPGGRIRSGVWRHTHVFDECDAGSGESVSKKKRTVLLQNAKGASPNGSRPRIKLRIAVSYSLTALNRNVRRDSAVIDEQKDRSLSGTDRLLELMSIRHRLVINFLNYIAAAEPRFGSRT